MGTFGSSTSPSWAGWDWPGSEYEFASKWTSPSFDVLATHISAYFSTINGNQAHGWLVAWNNAGTPIISVEFSGFIANGTQKAGGQFWYTMPIGGNGIVIPANSPTWIGGYSTQGTLFSTYDTSPGSYVKATSGVIGDFTSPSSTGQGPSGGYITYSPLNYGASTSGNNGGGLVCSASVDVSSSSGDTGNNGGGLSIPNTFVLGNVTTLFGDNGTGLNVTATVIVAQIKIWRL